MARILVVDDSYISRKNLKKILSSAGHEIAGEAEDGESAVLKYTEVKPDLVTLDITMPKMDGIETLKELIRQDAKAKVVMITSLVQKLKIMQALESGAKNYIAKPFEAENVISVINDCCK